ncbi:MAG: winged helix-turn-helix domain-containing protein, partial [Opitutaceae bacterium]|nr:winged helix-turn-helix domain-containing protein [Opitutaceae bacterium]
MPTEMTWRKAIDKVLTSSFTALHYNEIAERIIAEGYRKSLGATPAATVNAQISRSIKHDGDASPYIRVGKGSFALRDGFNVPSAP